MKKKPIYWQQGDVLFTQTTLPKEKIDKEITDGVIAKGEATGHAHRLLMRPPIKLFMIKTALYIRALEAAVIQHEEHNKIILPPGTYIVSKVREYDHFKEETREVAD